MADECSASPPYRDEEAPRASPAAVPQDSVLPADAKAAMATLASARLAGSFADAPECWADSEPRDAERPAHSHSMSRAMPAEESSVRRRSLPAEAVWDPIESDPAWEPALASRESPNPWEPPASDRRDSPAQGLRAPAHAPAEKPAAEAAQHAEAPDEATVSTEARTIVREMTAQSITEAAKAARDAPARSEFPRLSQSAFL